jgi:hypothetical protein
MLVPGSGFAPATVDPHVFAALLRSLAVGMLVFAEEKPCLLLGLEVAVRLWGWSLVRAYTGLV